MMREKTRKREREELVNWMIHTKRELWKLHAIYYYGHFESRSNSAGKQPRGKMNVYYRFKHNTSKENNRVEERNDDFSDWNK